MLLFPAISFILSSLLIMSIKRPKIEKSKQVESSSRTKNVFVSENAMFKHSIICNKHVISGQCVVLADFDHLNLTPILKTSSLDHFMTIKEQVYLDLVQYFYSNLSLLIIISNLMSKMWISTFLLNTLLGFLNCLVMV